ncbi:DUF6966 domain-containing protein [Williamsia maris]|uniref:DUF6966 domain-containing protein n=1 Tax=Williamsia maris TaxID=72806 RepID=A0ABT1HBF0_9NOCA|nr:hypothetical protein [Williamsia maris]MCP2175070.1 hypothetical protein [Williamsia maris]
MSNAGDGVDIPEQLLVLLRDFELALVTAGVDFWARRIGEIRPAIAAGDPYAVQRLFTSFGGSGSLNDLQLDGDAHRMKSEIYLIAGETWRQIRHAN